MFPLYCSMGETCDWHSLEPGNLRIIETRTELGRPGTEATTGAIETNPIVLCVDGCNEWRGKPKHSVPTQNHHSHARLHVNMQNFMDM